MENTIVNVFNIIGAAMFALVAAFILMGGLRVVWGQIKRLGGSVRMRLERWVAHTITPQLNGLHERVRMVEQRADRIRDRLTQADIDISFQASRISRLDQRVSDVCARGAGKYDALRADIWGALGGGSWTSAGGYTTAIALLSDTHLASIIDGGFGSDAARDHIKREIARRSADDSWAAFGDGPDSLRDRVTALETRRDVRAANTARAEAEPVPAKDTVAIPGIPGRTFVKRKLTRAEEVRVGDFLPLWARELIKELSA